jgi:hypothetical protein
MVRILRPPPGQGIVDDYDDPSNQMPICGNSTTGSSLAAAMIFIGCGEAIITFIIAAYGATLSTFTFVRSVISARKLVKISWEADIERGPDGKPTGRFLKVTIVNIGSRSVVVNGPEINFHVGAVPLFSPIRGDDTQFPAELKDGGVAIVRNIKLEEVTKLLAASLRVGMESVTVSCTSSTGERYFGNSIIIDVAKGVFDFEEFLAKHSDPFAKWN